MPKGEGPPMPKKQRGVPKPEPVVGQVPEHDDVVARGDAATHDDAAAHEQPSVETLKAELFDREVPEGYRAIIDEFEGFEAPDYATPLTAGLPVRTESMRQFLREKIQGATMFDLGCGRRPEPVDIAAEYDAKRYVGVDLRTLIRTGFDRHERRLECYRFEHEDMLGFVSKLKDGVGGVYLLSALEMAGSLSKPQNRIYLERFTKEMARSLRPGDIVILTGGTDDFIEKLGPENFGFQRKMFSGEEVEEVKGTAMYSRVYEKVGENVKNNPS